jgi:uncharacterized protein YhbP (UPF0306 family)
MEEKLKLLTIKILKENQYLTLSTCLIDIPWSCIVTYVYDKDYNFYFMSEPSSKHIIDIKTNNKVSATIYDSRQKWGYGLGLQILGEVINAQPLEYINIVKLFFSRKYPYGGVPEINNIFKQVIDNKTYKFYKLIPSEIWVSDPEADVDGRKLVKL